MLTATEPATDAARIQAVFAAQQKRSLALRQSTASERLAKLERLRALVRTHEREFQQAIHADFGKPAVEVTTAEVVVTLLAVNHAMKHLRGWMAPRRVGFNLFLAGTSARVVPEPKGVSLIIAPWNYPLMLLLEPLVYALAAGNTAMLKPSELTPHTSGLVARLVPQYFAEDEVAVFEGGVATSTALLAQPFDHIFFTGSPAVGKVVMQAAAQHLASVTLELGGKSPVVVDQTADLRDAAQKIAWGKGLNAGQTCVAPDYVLVKAGLETPLIDEIKKTWQKFYNADGQGIERSPHLARIISPRHHARLVGLLQDALDQGAHLAEGGQHDASERFLAPTILTGVRAGMKVMQEEIFGPLLPVLTYEHLDEAIQQINRSEKPLASYLFSQDQKNISKFIQQTTAGGTCINDVVIQFGHVDLPTGGVNNSGLGKSHGIYGFEAFSNLRPVVRQRVGWTAVKQLYPPYTDRVTRLAARVREFFG
jgi:aldehyde dehydrogenase (NAD+)